MTAAAVPSSSRSLSKAQAEAQAEANAWLAAHHDELRQRARVQFRRWRAERREEHIAEMMAMIVSAVHSAARRGTLARLSPSTCVYYSARQVRAGRCAAGYSSTDALSAAGALKRGNRHASLDQVFESKRLSAGRWRAALADRDSEDPSEAARRRHDYALVLGNGQVSAKAHRLFVHLAETHGAGQQIALTGELMVTPGRLSQLKREVATALAAHGYTGPLGRRPSAGARPMARLAAASDQGGRHAEQGGGR